MSIFHNRPIDEIDPTGLDVSEPGDKLDAGKADLTFLEDWKFALEAVCRVAMYGAAKYSRGGWQYVTNGIQRYHAALLRHALGLGTVDPVPGFEGDEELLNAAQTAWNALSRLELLLRDR